MTTFFSSAVSHNCHCALGPNSAATGAKASRSSSIDMPTESARIAWRVKNQLFSGSVK